MTIPLTEITRQVDSSLRSDKSDEYLSFYEKLFAPIATAPLNILEVGVFHGGALLMFARYFPKARILGVDINQPPPLFYETLKGWELADRARVAIGSQDDTAFLTREIEGWFGGQPLDIVIDDASHMYRRTRATFEHVFYKHLKPGGHYIIEDWGCGYWPRWPDGNPNGRRGLPRLIKELVDLVALEDRTKLFQGRRAMRVSETQKSPVDHMIVYPSVVALVKAQTP